METQQLTPVIVYAEATPNPSTMKFVSDRMLAPEGLTHEYTTPESTGNSPLATKLFNFPFITGIFISSNFVTITKNNIVDWNDVVLDLREYIQDYLSKGGETVKQVPSHNPQAPSSRYQVENENNHSNGGGRTPYGYSTQVPLPGNELEKKIMEVLEEYVRPAVERDGGAIQFKSFANGILTVTLRGACSGCPSSSYTLKAGIKGLFEQMLPEVKDVVSEDA